MLIPQLKALLQPISKRSMNDHWIHTEALADALLVSLMVGDDYIDPMESIEPADFPEKIVLTEMPAANGKWMMTTKSDDPLFSLVLFFCLYASIRKAGLNVDGKLSTYQNEYGRMTFMFYALEGRGQEILIKLLKSAYAKLPDEIKAVCELNTRGQRQCSGNWTWKSDMATGQGVYGESNLKDSEFLKKLK